VVTGFIYRNQKMGRRGCITAPHLHFEVRVLKPDVPSVMIDDAFVKRKGKINDALYPSNPVSFVPDLRDRCS
jgi:murein DD-endopeptidase MepM/ murein hydrolase activator NlpD